MKMKRTFTVIIIAFTLGYCNDDNGTYTQVKSNERLIYLAIQAYRVDNGLDGPFVHQVIMVREAQIYSFKMANDVEELGTQGLTEHWNTIHEKIGGYNDQALVMKTNSDHEDAILSQMLLLPGADSILLEDLTQCAVGLEADAAGINFITVMLMKVDS